MGVSQTQVRQFETEKHLAALIMAAPAADRPRVYSAAYADLYRLFPDLQTDVAEEADRVATSVSFMGRWLEPSAHVVEIGAGRGHLAVALARRVGQMVALDVTALADATAFPSNMRHVLFDGLDVPLAAASADLVVSDNVLEHLHPDDAGRQIDEAFRILKGGGLLVVLTPNRINGPHDISGHFTTVPQGLHLKEYTSRDVAALLRQAGFGSVRAYVGAKGRYVPMPSWAGGLIERVARLLPRRLIRFRLTRWLLPNRFTALKPAVGPMAIGHDPA